MLELFKEAFVVVAFFVVTAAAILAATPPVFRSIVKGVKAVYRAGRIYDDVDRLERRLLKHEEDASKHNV